MKCNNNPEYGAGIKDCETDTGRTEYDSTIKYDSRKEYRRGYLTIELAMLMPGLMAVFILIIFAAYFVHDKCYMKRAAVEALYTDNPVETFESVLDSGLYAKWDVDAYVTKRCKASGLHATSEYYYDTEHNEVDCITEQVLTADCIMTSMQGMIADYVSDEFFCIHIEESMSNITGPDYIHIHRR